MKAPARKHVNAGARTLQVVCIGLLAMAIAASLFVYKVRSHEAYATAVAHIEHSYIVQSVGGITRQGVVPSASVDDSAGRAEYIIKVFGEQSDMRVRVYLERDAAGAWQVESVQASHISAASGNDLLIGAALATDIVALVFLLVTLVLYTRRRRFLRLPGTSVVSGTIIHVDSKVETSTAAAQSNYGVLRTDFHDRAVRHKTRIYRPHVEYRSSDGGLHRVDTKFSSSRGYEVGEEMPVIYNDAAPGDGQLEEFYWFWCQVLSAFALTFVVGGLGATFLVFAT